MFAINFAIGIFVATGILIISHSITKELTESQRKNLAAKRRPEDAFFKIGRIAFCSFIPLLNIFLLYTLLFKYEEVRKNAMKMMISKAESHFE